MPRAKNQVTTRPRRTTRLSLLSHANVTEGRATIYPVAGSEFHNWA